MYGLTRSMVLLAIARIVSTARKATKRPILLVVSPRSLSVAYAYWGDAIVIDVPRVIRLALGVDPDSLTIDNGRGKVDSSLDKCVQKALQVFAGSGKPDIRDGSSMILAYHAIPTLSQRDVRLFNAGPGHKSIKGELPHAPTVDRVWIPGQVKSLNGVYRIR